MNQPEYSKIVHFDETTQIRLTVNVFRDIEYLHLRKYYQDFETEEWLPSKEGISFPIDFNNVKELFSGILEILSLAESKKAIEEVFGDTLSYLYEK